MIVLVPAGTVVLATVLGRSAGTGSPYQLVPTLAVVAMTAGVWWWTCGTGPARTPAARDGGPGSPAGPWAAALDQPVR